MIKMSITFKTPRMKDCCRSPQQLTGVSLSRWQAVTASGGCQDKLRLSSVRSAITGLIAAIVVSNWSGAGLNSATAAYSGPDNAHLKAAADYSFSSAGQTFLVVQDGKIIAEEYAGGGAADRRQMLASGSKSFVGVAAVAAVQDGIINLDNFVSEAIPEWKNDPGKSRITYRELLSLTSGLTPSEPGRAVRAPAWVEIASKPMVSGPGEKFDYGAYHLNCFAYALERRLKNETFEGYLKRRILDPLGIVAEWRFRCDDGHPQVGGGAFVTARDWAKFGEMIQNNGRVGNTTLIEPALLALCFRGSQENPAYGLTWWLKKPVSASVSQKIPILRRVWAPVCNSSRIPDDLVAALGAGNQRLYVIQSLKLVIVRNASFAAGRRGRERGRAGMQRRRPSESGEPAPDEMESGAFSDFAFLTKLLD